MHSQKHSPRCLNLTQEFALIPKSSFCTPQKTKKTPRPLPGKELTPIAEQDRKRIKLELELEESRRLNKAYADQLKESEDQIKELEI